MSEETTKRKRRTPEELRAFHQEQLRRLDAEEKAEVLRLLSDAHDTIKEAQSLKAAASIPLPGIINQLAALIAQLSSKEHKA